MESWIRDMQISFRHSKKLQFCGCFSTSVALTSIGLPRPENAIETVKTYDSALGVLSKPTQRKKVGIARHLSDMG